MTILKPLSQKEIRNLNYEVAERLTGLQPLKTMVKIESWKNKKCYGIGLNDPERDLILRNFVRIMQSFFKAYPISSETIVALIDTSNTSRDCIMSGFTNYHFDYNTTSTLGTLLGFGNPASAPTPARTDYELASLVTTINPSSVTIDETNYRIIITGAYVWAAGGTVREAGMYYKGQAKAGTIYTFLWYHDATADVAVPAGGTVSVTYTTQF